MIGYITRRLLQFVISAGIASAVIFVLMQVLPGNAAQVALGTNANPAAVKALEAEYGLDRPRIVQYCDWVAGLLRGDFGTSYVTQTPITPVISNSVQVTLILITCAVALSVALAVPLGTLAAVHHRNALGAVISTISQISIAIPNFLAALILVITFSLTLGWLPASGWTAPIEGFGDFLRGLTLPVIALAFVQTAILTRYVRSAVLEVMREDFVRTARAKGLSFTGALVRHGLKNAAIPVLTVVGLQMAALIVGAVVVEQVFVIPGIGSELVRAVSNRDLVTVQGIVMVIVIIVLALNTVIDLLYSVIDPRVRKAA